MERGSKDAPHIIKIEYCGGWGYGWRVNEAIALVESNFPNLFRFKLYQDNGNTGRLEVTVYKDSKNDQGEGEIVHSKAKSKKYIDQVKDQFLANIDMAINCWLRTKDALLIKPGFKDLLRIKWGSKAQKAYVRPGT